MARLRAISGGKGKERTFSLVYGLRLYPAGTVARVKAGEALQHDGDESRIPLHFIEGTREHIRAQLLASIDAFFDIHGDESVAIIAPSCVIGEEMEEPGC